MAKVILLCGPQASGKSTHGKTLGVVIHSRDEVRSRLRSRDADIPEDVIWQTFLEDALRDVRAGTSVVLDSTLANPVRRDEAVAFFMSVASSVVIHRMRVSLVECHRRNNRRSASTKVRPVDIDKAYHQIEEAFASRPPSVSCCRYLWLRLDAKTIRRPRWGGGWQNV